MFHAVRDGYVIWASAVHPVSHKVMSKAAAKYRSCVRRRAYADRCWATATIESPIDKGGVGIKCIVRTSVSAFLSHMQGALQTVNDTVRAVSIDMLDQAWLRWSPYLPCNHHDPFGGSCSVHDDDYTIFLTELQRAGVDIHWPTNMVLCDTEVIGPSCLTVVHGEAVHKLMEQGIYKWCELSVDRRENLHAMGLQPRSVRMIAHSYWSPKFDPAPDTWLRAYDGFINLLIMLGEGR